MLVRVTGYHRMWPVLHAGQRTAARAAADAAVAQKDKLQSLCRVLQEERNALRRELAALKPTTDGGSSGVTDSAEPVATAEA